MIMLDGIAITDTLTRQSINDLITNRIDVIRVKDYLSKELCELFLQKLFKSDLFGQYKNVPTFSRVGQAYYEGENAPDIRQRYFDNSVRWIHQMREMCSPYLSPIDRLRLEIDELWPKGATLAILDGKKMFTGIARFYEEGVLIEPHQDSLPWHVPDGSTGKKILNQIGVNIYLKVPPRGGDLELWKHGLTKEDYFDKARKDSYGIDPNKIPPADYSIHPLQGELILFSTRKLHAVSKNEGSNRATWSCFIGFSGDEQPLMFWA